MMLEILEQAIRGRKCVTGLHRGPNARHFAPHALGIKSDGSPAAFVFQYAGETTRGLPSGGEWRCFNLDRCHT